MPSKATLLVLLAAPCVVESAAALPKEALAALTAFPKETSMATFIASNAALLSSHSGSGSGSWEGMAACIKDDTALREAVAKEQLACNAKCQEESTQLRTDMAAGTSAAGVCLSTDECSKYKAACHEKSPNALFAKTASSTTVKDSKTPMYPKDGTWSAEYGSCMPATCAGMPIRSQKDSPGVTTTGDDVVADGATSTTVTDMSEKMGVTSTTVRTWSALPEGGGIVMIIIIVVVVLIVLGGIGAAVSMKKGAKGGADAAAVTPAAAAPAPAAEEAPVAEEAPAADEEAPAEAE